jgi:hypothetical protein
VKLDNSCQKNELFLRIRIRGEFESRKKNVTRGWKISEMGVEFQDLLLSM